MEAHAQAAEHAQVAVAAAVVAGQGLHQVVAPVAEAVQVAEAVLADQAVVDRRSARVVGVATAKNSSP